jgi:hypothetical protein
LTPHIGLPFPLRSNPHTEFVESETRSWARRCGLVPSPEAAARFDAAWYGHLAGYIHPDAAPEQLSHYAHWLSWEFLADDQYGEGDYRTPEAWQDATAHLWAVFATGEAASEGSPIAHALADILGHVYSFTSMDWRSRFISHNKETFRAVTAENSRRDTRTFAPIEEYVRNRRAASSVLPCLALDEFMVGGEIPTKIIESDAYQELTQACIDVVAWSNDLYSWQKEEAAGEVDNFVLVLEKAEHLNRQHAVEALAARILRRAEEFVATQRILTGLLEKFELDTKTRRVVDRLLAAMRNWMSGTLAWSSESGRYTVTDPKVENHVPDYIENLLSPQT